MITKEQLKDYANKLMFNMDDQEYDTLLKEFDVILKQMEIIEKTDNIENVEPMVFPFELDNINVRADEECICITVEQALSNAKLKKGNEIKVPKVVE